MYCDRSILHLGGEIDGPTAFRKFGEYTFANFAAKDHQAVVSITDTEAFTFSPIPTPQSRSIQKVDGPISCTMYPNPTTNLLKVSFDRTIEEVLFAEIYDLSGQKIFSTIFTENKFNNKDFIIDVSSFPSGMYSIKILGAKAFIHLQKFIKI